MRWDRISWGPKEQGWGGKFFPIMWGGARRGRRPHLSASPHPIAIPIMNPPSQDLLEIKFKKNNFMEIKKELSLTLYIFLVPEN